MEENSIIHKRQKTVISGTQDYEHLYESDQRDPASTSVFSFRVSQKILSIMKNRTCVIIITVI